MTINYISRALDSIRLLNSHVVKGTIADVDVARALEALARKIRRNAEKNAPLPPWPEGQKGKYGRVCNANRKQYRADVNHYYWHTDCSVTTIAKHLGISEASVAKLIISKSTFERESDDGNDGERTTGHGGRGVVSESGAGTGGGMEKPVA